MTDRAGSWGYVCRQVTIAVHVPGYGLGRTIVVPSWPWSPGEKKPPDGQQVCDSPSHGSEHGSDRGFPRR